MDIISLPIEYDRNKIDGRFRIIAIAAQRAKELAVGAVPKVKTKAKKISTIALEETVNNPSNSSRVNRPRKQKKKPRGLITGNFLRRKRGRSPVRI
jgi:DNA-directed RNA polymerase subunit omega